MLEYKAAWYERTLSKTGRFYPSSKTCNECGFIHAKLPLAQREWNCSGCGVKIDRDVNAAKNILAECKRNFGEAIPENRHGDGVRPKRRKLSKASIAEVPSHMATAKTMREMRNTSRVED